MPGHVEGFSYDVQARHVAGRHGFGGDLVSVHAAHGDFGFGVSLGAGRGDREPVDAFAGGFDLRFGELAGLGRGQGRVQEQGGEAFGEDAGQEVAQLLVG